MLTSMASWGPFVGTLIRYIYMRGNSELILETTFWTHFDTLCLSWFYVDVDGKLGNVRGYPYSTYMRVIVDSFLILDTFWHFVSILVSCWRPWQVGERSLVPLFDIYEGNSRLISHFVLILDTFWHFVSILVSCWRPWQVGERSLVPLFDIYEG